jgi:hypothetical protein
VTRPSRRPELCRRRRWRTGRLRSGVAVLALAAALGTVALTGCEAKAGVAGFVGSTPIQTSQLSSYVDRGAAAAVEAKATVGRQEIQQFWLQTLIELQLAQRVGQQQGVALSPTETQVFISRYAPFNGGIDALRQSAAQIGIASQDLPTLFQAWALENRIADKVAPALLAPDSAARQAFEQLKAAYQGQTYEQLAPQLRQLLVFDQRRTAVLPVLQAEARKTGVRVNPRFGSWNIDRLGIGAPPTDLAQAPSPSAVPDVSSGETDSVPVPTP